MTEQAKHTPGPWTVANGTQVWKDGASVIGSPRICSLEGAVIGVAANGAAPVVQIDRDTQHANARLIAAAPVLLEACREMDENWHLIHDGLKRVFASHENPEYKRLFAVISEMQDAARAAIAQAEGGAAAQGEVLIPGILHTYRIANGRAAKGQP